jgi:hypothetical protein
MCSIVGRVGRRQRARTRIIIGTLPRPQDRNVIGTHGGSYSIYRARAVSSGALDPIRRRTKGVGKAPA